MPTTPTGTTTVRLPRRLVDAVRVIAAANERSVSAELRVALDEYARRKLPDAQRMLEERERAPMGAALDAGAKANDMLDPSTTAALAAAEKANAMLNPRMQAVLAAAEKLRPALEAAAKANDMLDPNTRAALANANAALAALDEDEHGETS